MKNYIKIMPIILALMLCVALTGCGGSFDYDDDAAIVKGNTLITVGSVTNNTSGNYVFTARKITGVKIIKDVTIGDNHVFEIVTVVNSGRFKVVLVKDNSVFTVCEGTNALNVTSPAPAGTYSLRIVGDNANCVFTYKY